MEWMIVLLFGLSAIFFILSFYQKNTQKELEKQIENLSIQVMQEIYYLKKKVTALEEEYIIVDEGAPEDSHRKSGITHKITRDDVLSMYEEGYSVEDIASLTTYSVDDIEELLAQ